MISVAGGTSIGLTSTAAISPYFFPEQIVKAAEASDTDRLNELINYELVQSSFAESIVDKADVEPNPILSGLAFAVSTTTITPNNTIQFFTKDEVDVGLVIVSTSAKRFDTKSIQQRYINWNTFEYRIASKSENNTHNEYTIRANRRGLTDWQVTNISFEVVEQTIPATTPQNTKVFYQVAPERLITADRSVSCSVRYDSVACANVSDEGMICDQNECTYDEAGDARFVNGAVYNGSFNRGRLSCTVTNTTVQCYIRNSSGEVTSEYVEILGDIAGSRG